MIYSEQIAVTLRKIEKVRDCKGQERTQAISQITSEDLCRAIDYLFYDWEIDECDDESIIDVTVQRDEYHDIIIDMLNSDDLRRFSVWTLEEINSHYYPYLTPATITEIDTILSPDR